MFRFSRTNILAGVLSLFLLAVFFSAGRGEAYAVIDVHEHVQSLREAKRLIPIMDEFGIKSMVILGSPEQTFVPSTFNGTQFSAYDENNNEILKIQKAYPDQFLAFCTGTPEDPELLFKIRQCVENGAKGVKLFSGHGTFHIMPLNDPSLDTFYAYLEIGRIPLIWHVNTGKYQQEFEAMLQKFPRLKIICPHFCMSSKTLSRFRYLMDKYPNLFTDMSFGGVVQEGFQTVSGNIAEFRKILERYQDRILWGTDFVITKVKTQKRIKNNYRAYRQQAERGSFFYLGKTYRGLRLPKSILRKIYTENFQNFMQNP